MVRLNDQKKTSEHVIQDPAVADAFDLLFFLRDCDTQVLDSDLPKGVKLLLSYVLQGIVGGGDPLLGLVDEKALRKARKLVERESVAYGFRIRQAGEMPRKNIIEILSRLARKESRSDSPESMLTVGRSSAYDSLKKFRHEDVAPMPKDQVEEELRNILGREINSDCKN